MVTDYRAGPGDDGRVSARDQRGGAGIRFLVVLTLVLGGWLWMTRPATTPSPGTATLASAPDHLSRRTTGWAADATAVITPGMRTFTGSGQCTGNFVFSDARGRLYLGQAAHCAETDQATNGCRASTQPLGTRVAITSGNADVGMGRVLAWGHLAYSSWNTMRRLHERDPVLCAYNDFALVRLPPGLRHRVNPSMPFWGGPLGLADHEITVAQHVYGFGRSELRKAGSTASRQVGITLPDQPGTRGWSHAFVARSPGIPGDSGSGYLDSGGYALGTLSTLRMGVVLVNAVGDLRDELTYARAHSGIGGLALEIGTMPFDGR